MTCYFRVLTEIPDLGMIRHAATPFSYPGGEWHLKDITDYSQPAVWIADVRGDADTLDIDLTLAHLFANVAHTRQHPFVLMLPYLPAARSDKISFGEPMGCAVYAERVNAMNPQQVIGIDAHSDMVSRYMPRLTVLDPDPLVLRALTDAHASHLIKDAEERRNVGKAYYDAVIAPDKGARVRAESVAGALGGLDVYHAEKHRDQKTGRILSLEMADKLPKSGRFLVVDDICDGGGTFKRLADVIGAPKDRLGLWVTHGIFSGDAISLCNYYQHIYTTDSHVGHETPMPVMRVPCETYMAQHLKDSGDE